MHTMQRGVVVMAFVAMGIPAASQPIASQAAEWPQRNVKFILPAPAGSSIDLAARVYGERLAAKWNRSVIVENNPGADGIIAAKNVIEPQDPHSLLFSFPGVVTVVPILHGKLPLNPATELLPISSAAHDFLVVTAPAALGVNTLADLATLARKEAGRLNWTTAPGAPYLTMLEFQKRAGIEMTYVPYKSTGTALTDVAAGRIHLLTTSLAFALPLAQEGKIKLLAVTTPERSKAAPETPTVSEAGYPELTVEAPLGLFGPKAMSPELRARIAADMHEVAQDAALVQRLEAAGMVVRTSTPVAYATMLDLQRARWKEIAEAYGMRPKQ